VLRWLSVRWCSGLLLLRGATAPIWLASFIVDGGVWRCCTKMKTLVAAFFGCCRLWWWCDGVRESGSWKKMMRGFHGCANLDRLQARRMKVHEQFRRVAKMMEACEGGGSLRRRWPCRCWFVNGGCVDERRCCWSRCGAAAAVAVMMSGSLRRVFRRVDVGWHGGWRLPTCWWWERRKIRVRVSFWKMVTWQALIGQFGGPLVEGMCK